MIVPSFFFTCPQEPDLKLPPSRLQDGICDCCDGADEVILTTTTTTTTSTSSSSSSCPNVCHVVLAQRRAARDKVLQTFRTGSYRRQQELQNYYQLVHVTHQQINQLEHQLEHEKRKTLFFIKQQIEHVQFQYMQQRYNTMMTTITSSTTTTTTITRLGLIQPIEVEYRYYDHPMSIVSLMIPNTRVLQKPDKTNE